MGLCKCYKTCNSSDIYSIKIYQRNTQCINAEFVNHVCNIDIVIANFLLTLISHLFSVNHSAIEERLQKSIELCKFEGNTFLYKDPYKKWWQIN